MTGLDAIVEERRTEQRDGEARKCGQRNSIASHHKIELISHLLHVLGGRIEDQAILKYDPCFEARFDDFDLRQEILPLVVSLNLIGIETFDAGKQTNAAGLASSKSHSGDLQRSPR